MSAWAGAITAVTASHRLEQTRKKHAWQQLFLDSLAVLHRNTQEADLSHEFFDTTPGKSYAATFLAPIFLGEERRKERRKASPKPQEQPKRNQKPMPKPDGPESPPAALASMNDAERKALASTSEHERKALASTSEHERKALASTSEDERKALASINEDERKAFASMGEDERHMAFEDASAAPSAAPAKPEAALIVITKKKKKKKHFHGQTVLAQGPARQWDPQTWRPLALTPRGYDTTGYDIGQAAHHMIDATPRRGLDPSYMRVVGEDVYVKSNTAGFEVPHGDLKRFDTPSRRPACRDEHLMRILEDLLAEAQHSSPPPLLGFVKRPPSPVSISPSISPHSSSPPPLLGFVKRPPPSSSPPQRSAPLPPAAKTTSPTAIVSKSTSPKATSPKPRAAKTTSPTVLFSSSPPQAPHQPRVVNEAPHQPRVVQFEGMSKPAVPRAVASAPTTISRNLPSPPIRKKDEPTSPTESPSTTRRKHPAAVPPPSAASPHSSAAAERSPSPSPHTDALHTDALHTDTLRNERSRGDGGGGGGSGDGGSADGASASSSPQCHCSSTQSSSPQGSGTATAAAAVPTSPTTPSAPSPSEALDTARDESVTASALEGDAPVTARVLAVARSLHAASAEETFRVLQAEEAGAHALVAAAALARLSHLVEMEESGLEDEAIDEAKAGVGAAGAAATAAEAAKARAGVVGGASGSGSARGGARVISSSGTGTPRDATPASSTTESNYWFGFGFEFPAATACLPRRQVEEEAPLSLEERGLVDVVVELLGVHLSVEGVQASGIDLLGRLAYCEASKQRAADSGALGAIATALNSHRHSKHVVQAGANALLKLTYDSALRSIMAIEAGVLEALQAVLSREVQLLEASVMSGAKGSAKGSAKGGAKGGGGGSGGGSGGKDVKVGKDAPLYLRLCEASSRSLGRYEGLRRTAAQKADDVVFVVSPPPPPPPPRLMPSPQKTGSFVW
eukprot:jgi/Chrpa1/11178/Chrysochromulina_OHIO_Genome00016321-RA